MSGFQVAIDELVEGTENIRGSIPAGADDAAAARDEFYRGLADGFTRACMPDQKIHVYAIGAEHCACKKESK